MKNDPAQAAGLGVNQPQDMGRKAGLPAPGGTKFPNFMRLSIQISGTERLPNSP
jgi:hypothetical protein